MTTEPDQHGGFGAQTTRPRIVPRSGAESLRPQLGTPPPRRSRRSRSQFVVFLNFVVSSIVLLAIVAMAGVYYGKVVFEGPGPSSNADTVLIRPATGVADIADLLQRRGLISDARIFRLGARIHGADSRLKAGEYEIRAGASMREIMELLESGRSVLYALTIPEGFTVHQAMQRIASMEQLEGDLPGELPPEGALAADTLRFTRGMKRDELVSRLMADQKRLVESVWERRVDGLPINDINEFVTLASIVEKETGRGDERSRGRRLHQPAQPRHAPPVRSDHHLRHLRRRGEAGRPADLPLRHRHADALQHLHDQRTAAGADRHSRPRLPGGGGQSLQDQ
jgi:UPF0755 protein